MRWILHWKVCTMHFITATNGKSWNWHSHTLPDSIRILRNDTSSWHSHLLYFRSADDIFFKYAINTKNQIVLDYFTLAIVYMCVYVCNYYAHGINDVLDQLQSWWHPTTRYTNILIIHFYICIMDFTQSHCCGESVSVECICNLQLYTIHQPHHFTQQPQHNQCKYHLYCHSLLNEHCTRAYSSFHIQLLYSRHPTIGFIINTGSLHEKMV